MDIRPNSWLSQNGRNARRVLRDTPSELYAEIDDGYSIRRFEDGSPVYLTGSVDLTDEQQREQGIFGARYHGLVLTPHPTTVTYGERAENRFVDQDVLELHRVIGQSLPGLQSYQDSFFREESAGLVFIPRGEGLDRIVAMDREIRDFTADCLAAAANFLKS